MELSSLYSSLCELLKKQQPALKIRNDNGSVFEVCGTIPAMQGKQKVDGLYFASVMLKPNDVRFYFFPIYTHPDMFTQLSPALRKCLKGKSCFHLKSTDADQLAEIEKSINAGIVVYQRDGLI